MLLDRLSGLLILLAGAALALATWDIYVPYQYEPVGPKAMPALVSMLLITCGSWLLLRPHLLQISVSWSQLPVLLLLLAYGWCYEPLGFVISTLLMTSLLAWHCGARPLAACGIGVAMSLLGYLLLVAGLGLQLPAGLLPGIG